MLKDEERAKKVAALARKGYELQGRRCVYVRTRVTTKYNLKAAKSKGKVSRHMAELVDPELVQASGIGRPCSSGLLTEP